MSSKSGRASAWLCANRARAVAKRLWASGAPPRGRPVAFGLNAGAAQPASAATRSNVTALMSVRIVYSLIMRDDEEREGPPDPLAEHLDRGWDLLKQNDLAGARISAQAAQALDPRSPEALTLLGAVAAAEGDEAAALALYRRAMQLDPEYVAPML